MNIKLMTERHLEFLSLKGGCTGLSESIHVKMPHWWKLHVTAHLLFVAIGDVFNVNQNKCFHGGKDHST